MYAELDAIGADKAEAKARRILSVRFHIVFFSFELLLLTVATVDEPPALLCLFLILPPSYLLSKPL